MSPRSSHPQCFISWHMEIDLGLWAKNDTFLCHTESEFLKTGKPPGFFKLFSMQVWKILFPDKNFDSHFTKNMGTWLNCFIITYKRALSRNSPFQFCPLQHKQNSMLVFRHSCYTMLSNLVDFIFLRPLFGRCSEAWFSLRPFPLTSGWAAERSVYWNPELVHDHFSFKI